MVIIHYSKVESIWTECGQWALAAYIRDTDVEENVTCPNCLERLGERRKRESQ